MDHEWIMTETPGNPEQSLPELMARADEGDVAAQLKVGLALSVGDGCVCDVEQAAYYLELAAEAGDEIAMQYLESLDAIRQPAMNAFDRDRLTGWFPVEVAEADIRSILPFNHIASEEPLSSRITFTGEHRTRSMDTIRRSFLCKGCNKVIESGMSRYIPQVNYQDLKSLLRFLKLAKFIEYGEEPACPRCGRAVAVRLMDYHIFHSRRQSDFVVRIFYPYEIGVPHGYAFLWWRGHRYDSAADFSEEDGIALAADAVVRDVALTREFGDRQSFFSKLKDAISSVPGHGDLLHFVGDLQAAGQFGLAEVLTETHTESHPQDPDGWFWRADSALKGLSGHEVPESVLEEIAGWVERARTLRPDHIEAHCMAGSIKKMLGEWDEAREIFETLIESYPDYAPPCYQLGQLLFDDDSPVQALRYFKEGAKRAPGDVSFPIACIECFMVLKMLKDAQIMLGEAKKMAPEHPKLMELERALEVAQGVNSVNLPNSKA